MFKKLLVLCLFSFLMVYAQEEISKKSFQEIKDIECFPAFNKLPDFTIFRAEEYVYSDLYYQIINYLIDNNLTDYEACLDDMKRVLSEEFIQDMNDTYDYFNNELEDLTEEAEEYKKVANFSLGELESYINEDLDLEEKNDDLLMLIHFYAQKNKIEEIESLIPLLDNINPDFQKRASSCLNLENYNDRCWKDQGNLILMKLYFKMNLREKAELLFDEIEDQKKKIQAFALMTQFYMKAKHPFSFESSFKSAFIEGVFLEAPHNYMFWLCLRNYAPEIYYNFIESCLNEGGSLTMIKNAFGAGGFYVDRNTSTYVEDYLPYNFAQSIYFIRDQKYSEIANIKLSERSTFEKIINTRLMEEYYNNNDWENFDKLIKEYAPFESWYQNDCNRDYDERQVIAMQSYLNRGDYESAINAIKTPDSDYLKYDQPLTRETMKILMYYIVKKNIKDNNEKN